MTRDIEALIQDVCYQSLVQSRRLAVLVAAMGLLLSAAFVSEAIAGTNTAKRTTKIDCNVADGRSVVDTGREGRPEYAPSVIAQEGLGLGDNIHLRWEYAPETPSALRVAIDSPVTKGTRLISITDDTVSAVLMTSDSLTTRSWLISLNFRLERVMISGMSSNTNTMKAQIMTLSCTFNDSPATAASEAQ